MSRFAFLLVPVLAVAGCTAATPVPDLCDMPPGFRSCHGAEVEWSGYVIGEFHHGYGLACERRRRGITLGWSDRTIGSSAFEAMLERTRLQPGVLRITVQGRLGRYPSGWPLHRPDAPILRVRAVRRMQFVPMTETQMWDYIENRPS